ncbi:MAG: efflux RND transporter periplasmic adaptor subunit [Pseudomonadota bacterium]
MTAKARPPGNAGAHWARVAGRKLRLADSATVIRQEHRGVLWYVVHDRMSDRFYRFTPAVHVFLTLLDGKRTVEEAYQLVLDRLGPDAPTELDIIRLFWRLHAADLLRSDVLGRIADVEQRADALDRQKLLAQLRSPLSVRVPLLDPGPILSALGWMARAMYSVPGFVVWLAVVGHALGTVAVNWDELTGNFSDRVLSFDNLVLVWFVFPVVKLLHEFGHGLALRRWGCTSHELGIMFLVFMPVPYIDASTSATLIHPRHRAAVGAGGLYVEVFIAAVAAIIWAQMEPGFIRAICFNVMVIGGASAILFNGNPLLKFDAYYILSDLLEMPNLGQRSAQFWMAMIQKRILGISDVDYPQEARGEMPWLTLYAPLSVCYRLVLLVGIAIFVAKQFFFLGTVLAVLAVFNVIVWPIVQGLRFLFTSARLRKGRARAILRSGAVVAVLLAGAVYLPLPSRTVAQGVVWYGTGAELRPAAGGVVQSFHANSGQTVAAGQVIADLRDPETEAEIAGLRARLTALRAQHRREMANDRDKAGLTAEEITYVAERLASAQRRLADLQFTSPVAGRLIIPRQRDISAAWIGRGAPIGHVVGAEPMVVLAALRQSDMDLVSQSLQGVSVRLATDVQQTHAARLMRRVPKATDRLPADLLATQGGGPFSLRQNAPQETGLRTIDTIFVLEIAFDSDTPAHFGERAYIRFDHGTAPLVVQVARSLRQLFLREFEV